MSFRGKTVLCVILLLLSSLEWYAIFNEDRGDMRVFFLDVGQGDAIFIETPAGNQILIDGGAGRRILSELGNIMPSYDRTIDLVVATHTDLDHLGGLIEVIKNFDVGRVIENGYKADTGIFREWDDMLIQKSIARDAVRVGDRIMLDHGIALDILGPFNEDFQTVSPKANDVMVVARLVYGSSEFLFTGDLERGDEIRLAESGLDIKSDVLKVPHHGSKTSSSKLLLEKVSPRFSVVSVGTRNRYGHPHSDALGRLSALGATLFRTDEDGRIMFSSDGKMLIPD